MICVEFVTPTRDWSYVMYDFFIGKLLLFGPFTCYLSLFFQSQIILSLR